MFRKTDCYPLRTTRDEKMSLLVLHPLLTEAPAKRVQLSPPHDRHPLVALVVLPPPHDRHPRVAPMVVPPPPLVEVDHIPQAWRRKVESRDGNGPI